MLHCLKLYLSVTDLKVAPGVHTEDVDFTLADSRKKVSAQLRFNTVPGTSSFRMATSTAMLVCVQFNFSSIASSTLFTSSLMLVLPVDYRTLGPFLKTQKLILEIVLQ